MRKTVLILGSSGFIGKNLAEQLNKKYKLLTPSHKELDLLKEEAAFRYFKSHKIDTVIYSALVGGSRIEEYEERELKTNLKMFFNVIKSNQYYRKLINFGSGAEYDKTRSIEKVKETNFGERIPTDDYGLFKYTCSKILEHYDKPAVNLRIFGMFGKYEDHRYRFISYAILRNLKNLPIIMKQNVYFDYMFIDDFVRIVDYFINNDSKEKVFNIGTGKKIDLVTIAKKINRVADKKTKIIIAKPKLKNEYTCNNKKLMRELGQFTFMDFDTSLKKLYFWYKKNLDFY